MLNTLAPFFLRTWVQSVAKANITYRTLHLEVIFVFMKLSTHAREPIVLRHLSKKSSKREILHSNITLNPINH